MFYYSTFAGLALFSLYGAFLRELAPRADALVRPIVIFYCAVFLIAIAGFREGVDLDYLNYSYAYDCVVGDYECRMEPAFHLFSRLSDWAGYGLEGVIFLHALIAISIYAILICRSETPYLSLLTYFCTVFFLHEMTQIRIGLAVAIALFGLDYLHAGKRLKFLGVLALASTVHFSILAFGALAFMPKRHRPVLGITLVAICIALSLNDYLAPLYEALFGYLLDIESRFAAYGPGESELSRFGVVRASLLLIYLFAAFNARRIEPHVPKIHIYLNSMLVGICAHYLFFFLPVVPSRLLSMYGAVIIFLLPATMFAFRPIERWIAVFLIIAFCAVRLALTVESDAIAEYRSLLY